MGFRAEWLSECYALVSCVASILSSSFILFCFVFASIWNVCMSLRSNIMLSLAGSAPQPFYAILFRLAPCASGMMLTPK